MNNEKLRNLFFILLTLLAQGVSAQGVKVRPLDYEDDLPDRVDSFRTLHIVIAGNIYKTEEQIRQAYDSLEHRYDFSQELRHVNPIMNIGDVVIAQMKTSFTGDIASPYSAPDEFALSIKYTGINQCVLANKNTINIDKKGLLRTQRALGVFDIQTTGAFTDNFQRTGNCPLIVERKGFKVAILNYTNIDKRPSVSLHVGGDVIEKNGQAYVARGLGLLNSISDIENTIVDCYNGNPVLVKNVATVIESSAPRVGQVGLNENDDVVEGIAVMRKGENPHAILVRLKNKIEELNTSVLPQDVKMDVFYDRDNLMTFCTRTVMHNLTEGIIFVTLVILLFMVNWRTTIIVAIIIPLSLLFAFLCLSLKGMSANLLSLGAVDFGIIIDGAVVMVEGLFVALDYHAQGFGMERFNKLSKLGLIARPRAAGRL